MLAWHFLSEDKRLGNGDGRLVEVGATLECEGEPELCNNGMHGSARLIDALYYASGPIVCRVKIEGDVIQDEDKLCGRRRTVLWMLDATDILHEFGLACAEDALTLVDNPDPRSVAAIAAKRNWLRSEITDEELDSAWAAAWDAALAAARDEAYAAAMAAALDSAWAAARNAAWAARSAAWNASRSAAQDAAWAKQNERLTAMVMDAHEKERSSRRITTTTASRSTATAWSSTARACTRRA